ncbi:MAG TPA: hypothetical protein [Bacteriophage sp.]|nr:MAG TPA: hypothetical protein [Bacteriophage sp.]
MFYGVLIGLWFQSQSPRHYGVLIFRTTGFPH